MVDLKISFNLRAKNQNLKLKENYFPFGFENCNRLLGRHCRRYTAVEDLTVEESATHSGQIAFLLIAGHHCYITNISKTCRLITFKILLFY